MSLPYWYIRTSFVAQTVKNLPVIQEAWFNPQVGKIPWRRIWQPTPVFLPEEAHGQRSLAGYNPWGCKELDTTEQITLSQHQGHIYRYMHVLVAQLCPTLCASMDCSLPGFSVHGISQEGILEWAAIPFFRSSWPKDWICIAYVSCIGRWVLPLMPSGRIYTSIYINIWTWGYSLVSQQ